MSGRRPNNPPPAGAARQNEYFVPRDGIDREVITADVCRYLGNDALVRPGTYEHPDGRVIQGYYINAYRNLTSAMIQDLKADSSRWETERRAASRPSGDTAGGIMTSSAPSTFFVTDSNQPAAQSRNPDYRGSETHHQRQYYGPTDYQDQMAVDSYNPAPPALGPRYPGTGSHGYNGVASTGQYPQQAYGGQAGFAQQPQFGTQPPQQQYSPSPQGAGERYGSGASAVPAAMGSAFDHNAAEPFVQGARYLAAAQDRMSAVTYAPQSRPGYSSAGAQPGYPAPVDAFYQPMAGSANPMAPSLPTAAQPWDPLNGRGASSAAAAAASLSAPSPSDYLKTSTGNQMQGYSGAGSDAMQYESTQPLRPTGPASIAQSQMPSGTPVAVPRRERERERDRGERDRDRDRDRERERERDRDRDRDDRHAADRASHRHRNRP